MMFSQKLRKEAQAGEGAWASLRLTMWESSLFIRALNRIGSSRRYLQRRCGSLIRAWV
jgi:hypothetical protein